MKKNIVVLVCALMSGIVVVDVLPQQDLLRHHHARLRRLNHAQREAHRARIRERTQARHQVGQPRFTQAQRGRQEEQGRLMALKVAKDQQYAELLSEQQGWQEVLKETPGLSYEQRMQIGIRLSQIESGRRECVYDIQTLAAQIKSLDS